MSSRAAEYISFCEQTSFSVEVLYWAAQLLCTHPIASSRASVYTPYSEQQSLSDHTLQWAAFLQCTCPIVSSRASVVISIASVYIPYSEQHSFSVHVVVSSVFAYLTSWIVSDLLTKCNIRQSEPKLILRAGAHQLRSVLSKQPIGQGCRNHGKGKIILKRNTQGNLLIANEKQTNSRKLSNNLVCLAIFCAHKQLLFFRFSCVGYGKWWIQVATYRALTDTPVISWPIVPCSYFTQVLLRKHCFNSAARRRSSSSHVISSPRPWFWGNLACSDIPPTPPQVPSSTLGAAAKFFFRSSQICRLGHQFHVVTPEKQLPHLSTA